MVEKEKLESTETGNEDTLLEIWLWMRKSFICFQESCFENLFFIFLKLAMDIVAGV